MTRNTKLPICHRGHSYLAAWKVGSGRRSPGLPRVNYQQRFPRFVNFHVFTLKVEVEWTDWFTPKNLKKHFLRKFKLLQSHNLNYRTVMRLLNYICLRSGKKAALISEIFITREWNFMQWKIEHSAEWGNFPHLIFHHLYVYVMLCVQYCETRDGRCRTKTVSLAPRQPELGNLNKCGLADGKTLSLPAKAK